MSYFAIIDYFTWNIIYAIQVGLLISTHQTEPVYTLHLYTPENIQHGTSKITPRKESSAILSSVSMRSDSSIVYVDVYAICDQRHTALLDSDSRFDYVKKFMDRVSAIMEQLDPKVSVVLRGVESSISGQERYLSVTEDDKLVTDDTLLNLITYTSSDTLHDAIILLSARDMIKMKSGKNNGAKKGAALLGGMCAREKVAIVKDDGKFSGVNTAVHEFGHLMNSSHDGQGSSTKCPESGNYLMSRYGHSSRSTTFSECSKQAIAEFIRCREHLAAPGANSMRYRKKLPVDVTEACAADTFLSSSKHF